MTSWVTLMTFLVICLPCHAQESCVVDELSYKPTSERWHRAMKNVGVQGDCWIGPVLGGGYIDKKHKNGRRDTIIFSPPNVNFSNPVTVIFWWHGLGGFSEKEFTERILPNVAHLSLQKKNFVLVVSELAWSKNTSTPRGRQGRVWRGRAVSEDLSVYYRQVLKIIARNIVPKSVCAQRGWCGFSPASVVVIGHSAGGSAIMSAARSGHLDKIQPNRIIFSDAGYGRWTDGAWYHHVKDHTGCEFVLLVRKWDSPHKNTMRFLKRLGKSIPKNIYVKIFSRRKFTHSSIGNQALLWAFKPLDF